MTIWRPRPWPGRRVGPLYQAIAEALAADLETGRLKHDDRLPTHRELAEELGVTVGTVTRAYAEAQRRGLVRGEVGRGTYVRGSGQSAAAEDPEGAGPIDLGQNHPSLLAGGEALASTLASIAARSGAAGLTELLDYGTEGGSPRHRAAAAAWLSRSGIEPRPQCVLICCGAQHALAVALMAVTRPGDVLLVERLTYPMLKSLASSLRLKLRGMEMDEQGIRPRALEQACRAGGARALCCVPTLQNPTAAIMSEQRRHDIAAIARRYGVTVVEDDVYGLLAGAGPRALAALAPEETFFVTSLSKTVAPGLRLGILLVPPKLLEPAAAALRVTALRTPGLTAEIAARWIQDGTAQALLAAQRTEAAARQRIAETRLPALAGRPHRHGYHLWLPLAGGWRGESLVAAARARGVSIASSEVFLAGPGAALPPGLRLCLASPSSRARLDSGLKILADLLAGKPASANAIV